MNWKTITGLFSRSENPESRVVPEIERVEMQKINTLEHPIVMTQADIDHYGEAAKRAQKLAQEANQRLQLYHLEQNMNFIEKIVARLGEMQTTLTGVASVVVPLVGAAIGLTHPQLLVVNLGFSVLTAWLSKKDPLSAGGLTASFIAQALPAFGVVTPDWVVAVLNGIAGVLAHDQKPKPAQALPFVAIFFFLAQPVFSQTALPIPHTFRQNSTTITVVYDAKYCDSVNAYGVFDMRKKRILLNDNPSESRVALEQTFVHELIHSCLEHASYHKLSRNERFVERVSRALHEALTTMTFERAN